MLSLNNKGQNTAEYAIVIALVLGAAIAMQTYVKRSMQGGVKFTVDKLQSGTDGQYEPYYLQSSYNTTTGAHEDHEETLLNGGVNRTFSAKTINRTGYQKINATTSSTW